MPEIAADVCAERSPTSTGAAVLVSAYHPCVHSDTNKLPLRVDRDDNLIVAVCSTLTCLDWAWPHLATASCMTVAKQRHQLAHLQCHAQGAPSHHVSCY